MTLPNELRLFFDFFLSAPNRIQSSLVSCWCSSFFQMSLKGTTHGANKEIQGRLCILFIHVICNQVESIHRDQMRRLTVENFKEIRSRIDRDSAGEWALWFVWIDLRKDASDFPLDTSLFVLQSQPVVAFLGLGKMQNCRACRVLNLVSKLQRFFGSSFLIQNEVLQFLLSCLLLRKSLLEFLQFLRQHHACGGDRSSFHPCRFYFGRFLRIRDLVVVAAAAAAAIVAIQTI
mmetsp:Transcript_9127/g.25257  ORF Transcript_9127/g.25257 Transcript_9127/m.25257 type:complete len:232 (-) Transcript_9127:85-780(-)